MEVCHAFKWERYQYSYRQSFEHSKRSSLSRLLDGPFNEMGHSIRWAINSKSFISWKSPIVFETVVADLKQLQTTNSKPNEKIVEVLSNDIIRIEGQPICKGDDQTGKPFYGVIKRNNDGSSRTASKLYCSSLDSPLLCQSSYHFLAIGMGSLHLHSPADIF